MSAPAKTVLLKEITECPGYYAGIDGFIYSKKQNNTFLKLKPSISNAGYYFVSPKFKNNKFKSTDIHKLICETYHGKKPDFNYTIAHKDGNKLNNVPSNLQWKTMSDNHKDKLIHGTDDRGWKNSRSKLNKKDCLKLKYLLENTDLTREEIGKQFNISTKTVNRIVRGERYPGLDIKPKWNSINRRKRK